MEAKVVHVGTDTHVHEQSFMRYLASLDGSSVPRFELGWQKWTIPKQMNVSAVVKILEEANCVFCLEEYNKYSRLYIHYM